MNRQIGYDGNAPEFREKRGSEARDPITGAVIRQGELSPANINVDRLEWLLAHKRILQHQYAAGRQLQQDWELSQIGGLKSALESVGGGSGTNRLSDVKCDAIRRVGKAREAIGNPGWRILELVVLDNVSLGKAEARMGLPAQSGISALTVALGTLARHYRLA